MNDGIIASKKPVLDTVEPPMRKKIVVLFGSQQLVYEQKMNGVVDIMITNLGAMIKFEYGRTTVYPPAVQYCYEEFPSVL